MEVTKSKITVSVNLFSKFTNLTTAKYYLSTHALRSHLQSKMEISTKYVLGNESLSLFSVTLLLSVNPFCYQKEIDETIVCTRYLIQGVPKDLTGSLVQANYCLRVYVEYLSVHISVCT